MPRRTVEAEPVARILARRLLEDDDVRAGVLIGDFPADAPADLVSELASLIDADESAAIASDPNGWLY
jgi:hypothetical protein